MLHHQRKENIQEKYVVYYTFRSLKYFFVVILKMHMVYYITNEEIKCEIKWTTEWSISLSTSYRIFIKLVVCVTYSRQIIRGYIYFENSPEEV